MHFSRRQTDGISTRPLVILFAVCVSSVVALVGVELLFSSLIDDLNEQSHNASNRVVIGEVIVNDLVRLEALTYRIAAASRDANRREWLRDQVEDTMGHVREALHVLGNGGALRRVTRLSTESHAVMERLIPYEAETRDLPYVLEGMEIIPKLDDIAQQVGDLMMLLKEHDTFSRGSDAAAYYALEHELEDYMARLPSVFQQMNGNANRLFFESQQTLNTLTTDIAHRTQTYRAARIGLSVAVIVFVISTGVRLLRLVRGSNRRLSDIKRDLEFQKFALDQHAIVTATDAAGTITYANDKYCAISGYSQDEIIGQNHRIARSDEHDDAFFRNLWETISKGEVWHGEVKNNGKDGRTYWVDATIVPFLDKAGQPFQYIAIRTDITKRKRIEDQFRKRNHFLNSMTKAMGEGVFALDAAGCCTFVNPEAERLLRRTRNDMLGADIHTLVHNQSENGEPLPREQCPILTAIHKGVSYRSDAEHFQRGDGTMFPASVTTVPLVEADRVIGSVTLFQDISERKRAEDAMQQAREEAEQSNRFKSAFLASMSHEIRTPMNAVIGLSHLALQTELTRRQRDYLENISTASQNLLAIINDILDFSKIEAGKMSLDRVCFRLSEVLDHVVMVVYPKVRENALILTLHVDRTVPDSWMGDPVRLGQVLTNLAGNAVKFTQVGGVTITVSLGVPETPGATPPLVFSVTDTGIGMSPRQQTRLFEAFNQLDKSTTKRFGGTGLGLAISREILDLMNGSISVESAPGVGSTFRATVPLERPAAVPADDPVPLTLRGLHVAVACADAGTRESVTLMLERLGLTVVVCDGETVAAPLADGPPPAVLIIDDAAMNAADHLVTPLLASDWSQLPMIVLGASCVFRDTARLERVDHPVTEWRLRTAMLRLTGQDDGRPPTIEVDDVPSARATLAGARVLLVEDNSINQTVAREMLETAGIYVTVAGTGQEALAVLDRDSFDLVLMDIQMPGLDGLETTRRLRTRPELFALPVIAMTAHAMASDRELSLASGMNDHITKPIHPPKFFSTLARWLNRDVSAPLAPALDDPARETEILHGLGKDMLDVLDVRQALRSVNGNVDLLRRLVKDFARNQGMQTFVLYQAIRTGQLEDARMAAHTLKGTAATIGAAEVARCAATLEGLLARGQTPPESLVDRLSAAMSPLMQAILAIDTRQQAGDSAVLDEAQVDLDAEITALREALTIGDPAVDTQAEALVRYLPVALKAEGQAMAAAAADFDFGDALSILGGIEDSLAAEKRNRR